MTETERVYRQWSFGTSVGNVCEPGTTMDNSATEPQGLVEAYSVRAEWKLVSGCRHQTLPQWSCRYDGYNAGGHRTAIPAGYLHATHTSQLASLIWLAPPPERLRRVTNTELYWLRRCRIIRSTKIIQASR